MMHSREQRRSDRGGCASVGRWLRKPKARTQPPQDIGHVRSDMNPPDEPFV